MYVMMKRLHGLRYIIFTVRLKEHSSSKKDQERFQKYRRKWKEQRMNNWISQSTNDQTKRESRPINRSVILMYSRYVKRWMIWQNNLLEKVLKIEMRWIRSRKDAWKTIKWIGVEVKSTWCRGIVWNRNLNLKILRNHCRVFGIL